MNDPIDKSGPSEHSKIVLVGGSLQSGGAERVLSDMANFWSNRGFEVSLATWTGADVVDFYEIDPKIKRIWLDVPAPNTSAIAKLRSNLTRVRKLHRVLKSSEPDAVLSFIDWPNVLTILAATGLRTRIVVSERIHPAYHSGLTWPWKLLRRIFYRRADAVVAQTDDVARWLEQHCRASTCTIPNPLRNLPVLRALRSAQILAVGRLYHQKGFDILVRAFARIHHEVEGWEVVIVGAGPEYDNLLNLITELEVVDKVSIVDPVKNIESLMACAGLVVQPSRFEGFPNVILEAMGMGAPVISADCPSGPSEIIEDGVNGRLVPVGDVAALSTAIVECISNPMLRERLGNNAVKVREQFRQDTIMRQWDACLFPEFHEHCGVDAAREIKSER